MDWSAQLLPEERIIWQGRPAPRCFTFRNWKLAGIGLLLFLLCSFWLMLGLQLSDDGHPWFLVLIPLPLVIASFLAGPGQILLARIAWERRFYCLTERRVLIRCGLLRDHYRSIPLGEICSWQQKRYSEQLASIRLRHAAGAQQTVLHCLEQPDRFLQQLTALLEEGHAAAAVAQNSV